MSEAEPLAQHPMYCKIRTVGRGQRSFVQVARNKATNELVAIRFIPRGWEPSHTKYVARAILNHQELSLSKHPHVVEFKEVFLTSRYLAEVLEYVEGETLQVFLEKVGGKVIEGLARFIFQQLIIALDFCHRKGKVNRDIKLSNILLSIAEGQLPLVKLCDFGFSKDTFRHSEPHSQVGTALFVAPEVMQNFTGGNYNGQAADVWACGVCVFIMLFGRHPYLRPADNQLSEQQQMIKLFQRMMQDEMEFPSELVSSLSPECLDLLRRMLKTRPGQRATMSDIQNHPWFRTALPEGANLMNDMFLHEDAACLSPQSHTQIEALVSLASRLDDAVPSLPQLPSQLPTSAFAKPISSLISNAPAHQNLAKHLPAGNSTGASAHPGQAQLSHGQAGGQLSQLPRMPVNRMLPTQPPPTLPQRPSGQGQAPPSMPAPQQLQQHLSSQQWAAQPPQHQGDPNMPWSNGMQPAAWPRPACSTASSNSAGAGLDGGSNGGSAPFPHAPPPAPWPSPAGSTCSQPPSLLPAYGTSNSFTSPGPPPLLLAPMPSNSSASDQSPPLPQRKFSQPVFAPEVLKQASPAAAAAAAAPANHHYYHPTPQTQLYHHPGGQLTALGASPAVANKGHLGSLPDPRSLMMEGCRSGGARQAVSGGCDSPPRSVHSEAGSMGQEAAMQMSGMQAASMQAWAGSPHAVTSMQTSSVHSLPQMAGGMAPSLSVRQPSQSMLRSGEAGVLRRSTYEQQGSMGRQGQLLLQQQGMRHTDLGCLPNGHSSPPPPLSHSSSHPNPAQASSAAGMAGLDYGPRSSAAGAGGPASLSWEADSEPIPDLDAMVMMLGEKELLQAATVDLRTPLNPRPTRGPQLDLSQPPEPSGSGTPAYVKAPTASNHPSPRSLGHHRLQHASSASMASMHGGDSPHARAMLVMAHHTQQGQQMQQGQQGQQVQHANSDQHWQHQQMTSKPRPAVTSPAQYPIPSANTSGGLLNSDGDAGGASAQLIFPTNGTQQQQQQQQQWAVERCGVQAAGAGQPGSGMPSIYEGPDDGLPVLGSVSAFNPNFDWGQYATSFMDEDDQGIGLSTDHFHAATFTRACRHVSQRATESNCPADQLPPAPDFSISLLGGDMEGDLLSQYIYQD